MYAKSQLPIASATLSHAWVGKSYLVDQIQVKHQYRILAINLYPIFG